MIRLLIADDHQIMRSGLRQLCEVNGGFTVVAEAANGAEAVRLAREHQPDVILMDIRMPDLTGVEAVGLIRQEKPDARILMLTMYRQDHYVASALQAGAVGYLLKSATEENLFAAIRAAHRGEGWLDPAVTRSVLAQLGQRPPQELSLDGQGMEILRLVAQGADNRAIAERLHLAPGTVANRLREIYRTLGVANRTEAALFALRKGWVELDAEE
jgi:DNA-binding NarL/FixJ family response regulator